MFIFLQNNHSIDCVFAILFEAMQSQEEIHQLAGVGARVNRKQTSCEQATNFCAKNGIVWVVPNKDGKLSEAASK